MEDQKCAACHTEVAIYYCSECDFYFCQECQKTECHTGTTYCYQCQKDICNTNFNNYQNQSGQTICWGCYCSKQLKEIQNNQPPEAPSFLSLMFQQISKLMGIA